MKYLFILMAAGPLLAQTCSYSTKPTSFTFGSDATPPQILQVLTQVGCAYTATAGASWIHITNPQVFQSNQTINFTVDQNADTQYRSTVITIADNVNHLDVAITQAAGTCVNQISSASASYPLAGGTGSFQVTTGCQWTVSSNAGWARISAPVGSTIGNGTVSYTVAANGDGTGCVAARSTTLTVNVGTATAQSLPFSISQPGSNVPITFASSSATFGSVAVIASFQLNAGNGCTWKVATDVNWIQIANSSVSGTGNGTITFGLSQNTAATRTGHITSGSQVFTITQTGVSVPTPVLSAIVNSASGATGAVSPGEIVALYGSNMGPSTGVAFSQTVPTSLAGVQVMFGSFPAPLTYVSASQINAVVPYGLAPGGTAPVTVQYQNQSTPPFTANVQAVAPAIFSADLSGHGPGAILNSDYSLNSGVKPAAIGSVVMIYATGGGVTNPPSADASPAPSAEPFARLVAPVSVTIGGVAAQVLYAGGSPGLVSGLTQINAIVPPGVTPGPSVPVTLQMSGVAAQSGITVAVQ